MPTQTPSGAQLASGTVSSANTVTFDDLAEKRSYVAFAAGQGVRFTTPVSGTSDGVLSDRARIRELELASSQGGGTIILEDAGTGWPARPSVSAPVIWVGVGVVDPTELMAPYDIFVGPPPS